MLRFSTGWYGGKLVLCFHTTWYWASALFGTEKSCQLVPPCLVRTNLVLSFNILLGDYKYKCCAEVVFAIPCFTRAKSTDGISIVRFFPTRVCYGFRFGSPFLPMGFRPNGLPAWFFLLVLGSRNPVDSEPLPAGCFVKPPYDTAPDFACRVDVLIRVNSGCRGSVVEDFTLAWAAGGTFFRTVDQYEDVTFASVSARHHTDIVGQDAEEAPSRAVDFKTQGRTIGFEVPAHTTGPVSYSINYEAGVVFSAEACTQGEQGQWGSFLSYWASGSWGLELRNVTVTVELPPDAETSQVALSTSSRRRPVNGSHERLRSQAGELVGYTFLMGSIPQRMLDADARWAVVNFDFDVPWDCRGVETCVLFPFVQMSAFVLLLVLTGSLILCLVRCYKMSQQTGWKSFLCSQNALVLLLVLLAWLTQVTIFAMTGIGPNLSSLEEFRMALVVLVSASTFGLAGAAGITVAWFCWAKVLGLRGPQIAEQADNQEGDGEANEDSLELAHASVDLESGSVTNLPVQHSMDSRNEYEGAGSSSRWLLLGMTDERGGE